jgi:dolichol-phosphate mannosyltransferase
MYRMITEDGYDVVNGRKKGRRGRDNHKRYAFFFHMLFRNIGEAGDIKNYGNFSMMTRQAADTLVSMKERVRYLPGLRTFIGFRQGYVDFVRDRRFVGRSKMSTGKLFMLAFDAIFSFSRFPVQLCMLLGTAGTIIFMLSGIYYLITMVTGLATPGWSPVLLAIFFLGSVQLMFTGIIGEYIYRNYKESQGRPLYIVKKIYDRSHDDR